MQGSSAASSHDDAPQLDEVQNAAREAKAQTLVDQVLNLGYFPREYRNRKFPREYRKEESKLARQIRDARKKILV